MDEFSSLIFLGGTEVSIPPQKSTDGRSSKDLDTWLGSAPIYKPYKGHLEGVPQPDP